MATVTQRNGRWQVQIRRKGHRPLSKHFSSKTQAISWGRITESEIDRGVFQDRSEAERTVLGDVLRRYRNEVTPRKRGRKQESSRVAVILRHPICRQSLATLRSGDIAAYRDERLQTVCGTTVNKELNLLAHAIDTARRDWSIHAENPVRVVSRPKANRGRDRRLGLGEEATLVAATQSPELRFLITLALETAMRRGELLAMKWSHINFSTRVLRIPQTKTDTPRQIPLSKRALATLSAMPRRLDGSVFAMRPQSVTQAFERACKRAKFADLRFHDLRHEATSRLFERGLNPMQVAAITGHRTLAMLQRYTHLRAEDLAILLG